MTPDVDDPAGFRSRTEVLNGMRWHVVDEGAQGPPGSRPLLILLHGFPYTGYGWRKVIRPLAAAGYRAVAPDLLGHGRSEVPSDMARYAHLRVVADLVALVERLGEPGAVLIGHDVGASIAFAAGQMRPDRFTALVLMNTPPMLRSATPPAEHWQQLRRDTGKVFYQEYFAGPDAVAELDADIRRSLRSIMFSISGDAVGAQRWRSMMAPGEGFLDTVVDPPQFPAWLSAQALEHYVAQYSRHGFFGPLASYRCRALNWDQCAFLAGMRPPQPALFIGGAADPALDRFRPVLDRLETTLPGLRGKPLIAGAGHSVAEESPEQVLAHVLPFLAACTAQRPGVRSSIHPRTEET
jgi:pimeloyl-ACP methyl ester carboxylesterase